MKRIEIWPTSFKVEGGLVGGKPVFLLTFEDQGEARAIDVGLTPAALVALEDELRMRTEDILAKAAAAGRNVKR